MARMAPPRPAQCQCGALDRQRAEPQESPTMKSNPGNFFEDFTPGQEIVHATPRTLTEADAALNIALTGARHAL